MACRAALSVKGDRAPVQVSSQQTLCRQPWLLLKAKVWHLDPWVQVSTYLLIQLCNLRHTLSLLFLGFLDAKWEEDTSSFPTFIAGWCGPNRESILNKSSSGTNTCHCYSHARVCKIHSLPGFLLISPLIWNKCVLSWACVSSQSWLQSPQLLCWPRSWPNPLQESRALIPLENPFSRASRFFPHQIYFSLTPRHVLCSTPRGLRPCGI